MRIISRMNVGGPAVQVSGLMRGLSSIEFDHRLYTGYCEANEMDFLNNIATDVEAVRIEGFGRRVSFSRDVKAFLALVKAIREFEPNVIHTHTAKAGLLGRTASVFSLKKSILVHTYHGHLLNGYYGTSLKALVVITEKFLGLFTNYLLAVGYKVRQDLLEVGIGSKKRFGLMPPGLSIGMLPPKNESRDYLSLPATPLQCAFIGRVTKIKRPDRFLDVVSEMKRRGTDLGFFIAGDGELLEMCRRRIAEEALPVTILGWQKNIEMVLSAADIVLLTSDNEGTPLSLIQAGMAGLPVIATNVGSISDIVLTGSTGYITSSNVQEIADALEKLAGDKDLCARLGHAAQEFTLANFGLSRLVKDHEELYKNLLSNQARF
jgi:glycosyltransferase involved in cell wall biosynthesis